MRIGDTDNSGEGMTAVRDPEVASTLGLGAGQKRMRWVTWLVSIAVLAGLAFLGNSYLKKRAAARLPQYVTEPVKTGDIEVVVTATGTLLGLNTVEVGAEVSGRVARVLVDYNDRVKVGQVLAEIDPEQSKAAVDEASARVSEADAAVHQAKASLIEAEQNAGRAERPRPRPRL